MTDSLYVYDLISALEIERLVTRADRDDESALMRLCRDFVDQSIAWKIAIRTAAKSRRVWLCRLRAQSRQLAEAFQEKVNNLRARQLSETSTPLEILVFERTIAAWMAKEFYSFSLQDGFSSGAAPLKDLQSAFNRARKIHARAMRLQGQVREATKMASATNDRPGDRSKPRSGEQSYCTQNATWPQP